MVRFSDGQASGFLIPFRILTIYKPDPFLPFQTGNVRISDSHCNFEIQKTVDAKMTSSYYIGPINVIVEPIDQGPIN